MGCFQQTQKFWKQQFFGLFPSGVVWRGLGPPPGVAPPINALATNAAGLTLMVDGGAVVWASSDGGRSWSVRSMDLVPLAFFNTECNLVASPTGTWMIANGDAFRSTDDGATWTEIPTGVSSAGTNSIATDGAGTWVGFVNVFDADYQYSNDDGLTWTPQPMFVPPGAASSGYPPIWDGTQFSVMISGRLCSSPDGLTWSQVIPAGNLQVIQLLFNPLTGFYIGVNINSNSITLCTSLAQMIAGQGNVATMRGLSPTSDGDTLSDGIYTGPDIFMFSQAGRGWNSFDGNLWAEDTLNLLPAEQVQFGGPVTYDPAHQCYILGGSLGSICVFPP